MEASAVLGSLAGIGEIAKATFGPDGTGMIGSGPPRPPRNPTGPTTASSTGFTTPGYTPPRS